MDHPQPISDGLVRSPDHKSNKNAEECRAQFLWHIHDYTNEYIRFADAKAGVCVGIASALLGALFATKCHTLFTTSSGWQHPSLSLLAIASFLFLGFGIFASLFAVRPRLWTHSQKGLIFWGAIARFETADSFAAHYDSQSPHSLTERLSHNLYSLSKICVRKYFWVSAAILATAGGGVLAALVLLLKS